MKTKRTYSIEGMHCVSCAMLIEGELEDRGVTGRCSYAKQTVEIDSDDTKHVDTTVKEAVEAAGYHVRATE